MNKKLKDIRTTTMTIMAKTDYTFDIKQIFDKIPIYDDYIVIKKVKGRRQKRNPVIIPGFNENNIKKYSNWDIISQQNNLSEEFIERNVDKVNWKIISFYQTHLSKEFLFKYRKRVYWNKVIENERGEKIVEELNQLKSGVILCAKHKFDIKGIPPVHKKKINKSFLNSTTIIIYSIDKFITCKLYSNCIHCTGCKSKEHAFVAIQTICNMLDIDDISFNINIIMHNRSFIINKQHIISLEKISTFFNKNISDNHWRSFYNPDEYPGASIQYIPSEETKECIYLLHKRGCDWVYDTEYKDVSYYEKETNKNKNVGYKFTIFHTGKISISISRNTIIQDEIFLHFIKYINLFFLFHNKDR